MAFSKLDLKSEVLLSLPAGGQIQDALIDHRINSGMRAIFLETEILKLARYINETKDEQFYSITSSGNNEPSDIESINVCSLSRVTHKDGASDYDFDTVKNRTVVPKSHYSFVSAPVASKRKHKLYLHQKSSETKTAGLELIFSATTASVDYVDQLFINDFRDTLIAYLKYDFFSDGGKPWANPNTAQLERRKYYEGLNRLRFKSNTGFTNGTMTVSPSYGFII